MISIQNVSGSNDTVSSADIASEGYNYGTLLGSSDNPIGSDEDIYINLEDNKDYIIEIYAVEGSGEFFLYINSLTGETIPQARTAHLGNNSGDTTYLYTIYYNFTSTGSYGYTFTLTGADGSDNSIRIYNQFGDQLAEEIYDPYPKSVTVTNHSSIYIIEVYGDYSSELGDFNLLIKEFNAETIAPDISSPADIEYEVRSNADTIIWTVGDQNPDVYKILIDGVVEVSETEWSNGSITFNTILSLGEHEVTLEVYDIFGNKATDTVEVTVLGQTTSDEINEISYNNSSPISWYFAILGLVGLLVLYNQTKSPKFIDSNNK